MSVRAWPKWRVFPHVGGRRLHFRTGKISFSLNRKGGEVWTKELVRTARRALDSGPLILVLTVRWSCLLASQCDIFAQWVLYFYAMSTNKTDMDPLHLQTP